MLTAGSLAIILFISFVFAFLAKRLHFSEVIGLMLAGIFFSSPVLREYFIGTNETLILNLSHLSIMALMFVAGLEVSWSLVKQEKKDSLIVTLFTVTTSLIVGVAVLRFLNFSWEASIITGVCFGITAEATKARALLQLKKLQTRIGALLMGIGIINDIVGVLFLVFVSLFFAHQLIVKDAFLLLGIIASFALGIFVHYKFNRHSFAIKRIEQFLFIFVIPFFFVGIGHYINLSSIEADFWLIVLIFFSALFSQMLGVYLTRTIIKLSPKQLYLVGWGMNSKGLVELAIAFAAMDIGLINLDLYTAIVISSLMLTICFQIIIFKIIKNDPGIME
jgi:Kef-type K+ transport system membrane component KefB